MDSEGINNLALRESLRTPLSALNLIPSPDHLSNCKYEQVTNANRECSNMQLPTLLLAVVKGRKWTILDVHINCLQFPCCVLITSLMFILMCSLFFGWIIPLETSRNSRAAKNKIKWSFHSQGLFHIGGKKRTWKCRPEPTLGAFFHSLSYVVCETNSLRRGCCYSASISCVLLKIDSRELKWKLAGKYTRFFKIS